VYFCSGFGPSGAVRPGDASVRPCLSGCVLACSFVRLAMASPSSAPRLGWFVTVTSRGFPFSQCGDCEACVRCLRSLGERGSFRMS